MSKRPSSTKPPGQRQLRVAERIRHILSDVLRNATFRDPDLQNPGHITITAVEIGPDLKHASVYVMPLGGKEVEKVIAALNRASAYLRTETGQHMDMRHTPKLSFHPDNSFANAAHIAGLLYRAGVGQADEVAEAEDEDGEEE